MGLLNMKSRAELPSDWVNVIAEARSKPEPFIVKEVDQSIIRDWSNFLEPLHRKKCLVLSRPVWELKVEQNHPRLIIYRDSYNGAWISSVVTLPNRQRKENGQSQSAGEFLHPHRANE
uniref:(California timema) hypothetical protein n=1 Tax=Timema californicum TaxID=61474 RepID=A0A7R9JDR7_TIMCA|nr:unnamed protein product [Timema californicum]